MIIGGVALNTTSAVCTFLLFSVLKFFLQEFSMKQKKAIALAAAQIILISAVYFILSLSCGGSAPEPEKQVPIDISIVNQWLNNYEEKIQVTQELSSKQLMEVTKLCLSAGDLTNVTIVEENSILSFAVLESKITVSNIPLKYQFQYSISKSGVLTMRIKSVMEYEPGKFKVAIAESELQNYEQQVIKLFSDQMRQNADIVIKRSSDFA